MTPPRVVLFDLDGTLTRVDSLPFLLAWALAFRPWRALWAVTAVPALIRFVGGRGTAAEAKQALLCVAFGGLTESRARAIARSFARRVMPALERRALVERLLAHRAAGDRVWIVSASPELVCAPLAAGWGIEGAIGTRLEVLGRRVSGRLDGPNCAGLEKVSRLRAALGGGIDMITMVYADDPERDGAMWSLARVPVRVPGPLPAISPPVHP